MIDVKIINAVLESLTTTFRAAAKTEIKLQKPMLSKDISNPMEILTTIGFNGALEGNVIYTLGNPAGTSIVNNMMEGMMEVKEIDEMALSAIAELGNMMSGSIATSLERIGYSINITPPSVVLGKDMRVSVDGTILKFPGFVGEGKEIDVYLIIKS